MHLRVAAMQLLPLLVGELAQDRAALRHAIRVQPADRLPELLCRVVPGDLNHRVVHSIAYSDKNELNGRYADTTRANFNRTMMISCFSFTAVAKRAAPLMRDGGGLLTLTYSGAARVMPHYNVMGVAKAALEASVRYLAVDLGAQGIRVNAISAGPMRTLAGSAIGKARQTLRWNQDHSPLQRNLALDPRYQRFLTRDFADTQPSSSSSSPAV